MARCPPQLPGRPRTLVVDHDRAQRAERETTEDGVPELHGVRCTVRRMPRCLNIAAFLLVLVGLGCETTKKVGTPLDRSREYYEDGDMDDAFVLASEAASSSDAATAQRGQLVAGLSAMDMGRPDAESWLLKASNGPDRESAGTALASMATIQERSGRIEAAAQSMHRASMMLSGSEQARARSEAQRLAKAVPSKSKPSSDAAQA